MKRAYINGILLDGTQQMEPQAHKVLLCEDGVITAVADEGTDLDGYEVIDLHGGYAMPGLINLHVHLAGNGKPSAKPRDNAALVRKILSNGLTRAVAYRMVCSYAKLELLGGVTTIRTVGGIADFDTRCRDDAQAGKILAPRILAANEGISVPGGHMAGSVAVAAHNNGEALTQLTRASTQRVDLVKLMITGGVLDAAEKGTPGELKMPPEMVKAVCDQAHAMGYPVAAHTESPEGVKAALENGVDSIEHGAKMDEETVKLYKEHGAFLCTTISPALPYALFDTAVSGASEKDQYNGRIVFDGIVESAKTALANGIPVGLGNDVGCPYITQYDFWRELCYFHKYCGVSNQFALYTATLRNAQLAGVGDVTGSLEVGKSEDLIVTRQNPLEDLRALQHLELVACRGRVVKKPAPKRSQTVDKLLDATRFIQIAAIVIMIFLIIVSIVVVSNTIKLTVFNRASEISIMKYVGATNWFIRGPFLAEGIIIGIISAGISVGASVLLYKKIVDVIGAQVFSVLSMPMVPVGFLTYNFTWIFLALGISIGACGSIISMRKFLDA